MKHFEAQTELVPAKIDDFQAESPHFEVEMKILKLKCNILKLF